MTSQSSGYITMGNRSALDKEHLSQHIPVPVDHFLMISFKRLVTDHCVELYRYNSSFSIPHQATRIWSHEEVPSDAAHMHYAGHDTFFLKAANDYKGNDASNIMGKAHSDVNQRFQFFFSFFSQNDKPQRQSQFVWNCSEQNYPSFQHHLTCNLWTECDDARDEHQHCLFSSAECQGLVAMCGRCYKFAMSLHRQNESDEYCQQLGGFASFPSCVYDPYEVMVNKSGRFWRSIQFHTGIIFIHSSLPVMYTFTAQSADRAVFFHYFTRHMMPNVYYTDFMFLVCIQRMTVEPFWKGSSNPRGVICEIRTNFTIDHHSNRLSVSSALESLIDTHYSFTQCQDGDVTYKHIACGSNRNYTCQQPLAFNCDWSSQLLNHHHFNSTEHIVPLQPQFICEDDTFTSLSYSLLCDFIADCPDSSDESFCLHPECGKSSFTCTNGQCVSYSNVCKEIPQCRDGSDKAKCRKVTLDKGGIRIPSPVLIEFDGIMLFMVTPMNSTDICPGSHYRCSGEFNDCLPIYTRCNGFYDCIGHEDENSCEEITCQGLLQCRHSPICVHGDHICDGWPHCPQHDDETWCDMACPVNSCLCKAHSFLCPKPFNAKLFPDIRNLDASGSGMTLSDVHDNVYLIHLLLTHCSLTALPKTNLLNAKVLDLSHNRLHLLNISSLVGLKNLQTFYVSHNPITTLHVDHASDSQTPMLASVDLSYTKLRVFDSELWAVFVRLNKLNLTFTCIHTISPEGFQYIPRLTNLYLDGSPVETFSPNIFEDLSHLRLLSTNNYKLCCKNVLPSNFDGSCVAPKDEMSSCEDLLQSWMYRGLLWLMACLAISGNIFCFCARVCGKRMSSLSGFNIFVTNLTMADLLMGVYMTIIGVADDVYRGIYLYHDHTWKRSMACKVAGVLSLWSSETSALMIGLITMDRFIVLCFPFSTWKFGNTSAKLICLLLWLLGWFLAFLPLLPVTAHWEFYGQTGICIPLPVMRKEFKGKVYSLSIMILLNLVLFLLISVGQLLIYWSIKSNTFKSSSSSVSKDMTIAQRLISIALTDFMCWFPIGLCGLLALFGIPVPGEVNTALAIIILPLNSAINPFMYTLNVWAEKQRKSRESELLNWLQTHSEFLY